MLIYTDVITKEEILTDAYPINLIDDIVYEVEGKVSQTTFFFSRFFLKIFLFSFFFSQLSLKKRIIILEPIPLLKKKMKMLKNFWKPQLMLLKQIDYNKLFLIKTHINPILRPI